MIKITWLFVNNNKIRFLNLEDFESILCDFELFFNIKLNLKSINLKIHL